MKEHKILYDYLDKFMKDNEITHLELTANKPKEILTLVTEIT